MRVYPVKTTPETRIRLQWPFTLSRATASAQNRVPLTLRSENTTLTSFATTALFLLAAPTHGLLEIRLDNDACKHWQSLYSLLVTGLHLRCLRLSLAESGRASPLCRCNSIATWCCKRAGSLGRSSCTGLALLWTAPVTFEWISC